jgi:hypothetical protein
LGNSGNGVIEVEHDFVAACDFIYDSEPFERSELLLALNVTRERANTALKFRRARSIPVLVVALLLRQWIA